MWHYAHVIRYDDYDYGGQGAGAHAGPPQPALSAAGLPYAPGAGAARQTPCGPGPTAATYSQVNCVPERVSSWQRS